MSADKNKGACCNDHHHCSAGNSAAGHEHKSDSHKSHEMKLLPVMGAEEAVAAADLSRAAVYRIVGMDCSSCAKSLEKHMKSLAAVQNVVVNFSTGKMQIVQEGLSDESIVSEVSKAGYAASP